MKGEREFKVKKEREQRLRSSWFGNGQSDVARALNWYSGGTWEGDWEVSRAQSRGPGRLCEGVSLGLTCKKGRVTRAL